MMHTMTEQENEKTEALADEIVSRLQKRGCHVSRENEKICVEHQVFLLSTGQMEFCRDETGSYMLPAEFGAEALTAFVLHILQEKDSIQCEAARFVRSVGIRPNLRGYHFLISAICLGLKSVVSCISVTETVYPAVASLYHVDTRCVERNIRNAVNDAYKNNPEQLRSSFYYKVDKPYDSELIALGMEKIRYKDDF